MNILNIISLAILGLYAGIVICFTQKSDDKYFIRTMLIGIVAFPTIMEIFLDILIRLFW